MKHEINELIESKTCCRTKLKIRANSNRLPEITSPGVSDLFFDIKVLRFKHVPWTINAVEQDRLPNSAI